MKSVIAQGSTISKAIEEALKKAGMPTEFFIKLLEDAQSGFLGFGAKKAKIALFFKQSSHHDKRENVLPQSSYENLFNNQALKHQIDQQLKDSAPEKQPQSMPSKQNVDQRKNNPQQHHRRPNPNFRPKNRPDFQKQVKSNAPQQSSPEKITVRPLPPKKNDQSK